MTGTTKIRIGEHWVDVPPEYVKAEAEYCREINDKYYLAATDDDVDEEEYARLRQATLDCRVEFWRKWNDTVPANNKNKEIIHDVHQSKDSDQ